MQRLEVEFANRLVEREEVALGFVSTTCGSGWVILSN